MIEMSQLRLIADKRFGPMFCTQLLGAFNDNFLKNALAILVTFRSVTVMGLPPAQIVAVGSGIFMLPYFLFSAFAGQIADKYEKGRVIKWIKIAEIAIMGLALVGFSFEQYGFLLFVLFFMGMHSTMFYPIRYSILPQHLETRELLSGNALMEAGTYVAILLGLVASGLVVAMAHGEVWAGAVLLGVSIIGYVSSRWIPKAQAVAPNLTLEFNPIPSTMKILKHAAMNRVLRPAINGISWFWALGAVLLSVIPELCKTVFGSDEYLVTLFLAFFSVGIASGSVLCGRLANGRVKLPYVFAGSLGLSVFSIVLGWLSGRFSFTGGLSTMTFLGSIQGALIAIALFGISAAGGFFIIPLYTFLQIESEEKHRSRVMAANNVINSLFMVLAAGALTGLMHFKLTIPRILVLMGILNLFMLFYLRNRMRNRKPAPLSSKEQRAAS